MLNYGIITAYKPDSKVYENEIEVYKYIKGYFDITMDMLGEYIDENNNLNVDGQIQFYHANLRINNKRTLIMPKTTQFEIDGKIIVYDGCSLVAKSNIIFLEDQSAKNLELQVCDKNF